MPGIDPPTERNWTMAECLLASLCFMTEVKKSDLEDILVEIERRLGRSGEYHCERKQECLVIRCQLSDRSVTLNKKGIDDGAN